MDGWTDGWMDGWMDVQSSELANCGLLGVNAFLKGQDFEVFGVKSNSTLTLGFEGFCWVQIKLHKACQRRATQAS